MNTIMTENIREKVLQRFLNYVKINTQSNDAIDSIPSSVGQIELAKIVKEEMLELKLQQVELDDHGYLYAVLPATIGVDAPVLTFCAHFDTSPDAPGENVIPIIREYDGSPLTYPDDPELILDEISCPNLSSFKGEKIITSSGKTLLGADDKAGIAEIMTALEVLINNPEINHPEIRVVFTPDEETGRGTSYIKREKLGEIAYTLDGGVMGELEDECFNAWSVKINFSGINVHPGEAKNKMVNAIAIACRFVSAIPEWQTPEHTEKREGFYHVNEVKGDETNAQISMLLRDFEEENNKQRILVLESIRDLFLKKYPGLKIELIAKESYRNMLEVLSKHHDVVEKAEIAIKKTEIALIKTAIRGGTDGARLSFLGLPCPNIFTGGVLFHSTKEWIPVIALQKATETILNLCELWINN